MTKKIYCIMASLLVAGIAMTSCNKSNEPSAPAQVKTYHMSVTASFGDENGAAKGPHKALGLNGNKLEASWDGSERVAVYNITKGAALEGFLQPDGAGVSTTHALEGNITGIVEAGDVLRFDLCSPDYAEQEGTLSYIATHCDYATGTGIAEIASDFIRVEGNNVYLDNQQCIMKMTLSDGSSALSPTAMTINDGTSDIATLAIPAATYTTNGAGIVFVAIPAVSSKALTFTATCGGDTYTFTSPVISLTNGKYYEQSITMTAI